MSSSSVSMATHFINLQTWWKHGEPTKTSPFIRTGVINALSFTTDAETSQRRIMAKSFLCLIWTMLNLNVNRDTTLRLITLEIPSLLGVKSANGSPANRK